MTPLTFIDFLVIGKIHRQTIIDLQLKLHDRLPGGSALYAASGIRCWADNIGVVSRIDDRLSIELFPLLDRFAIDHIGIEIVDENQTSDEFLGYLSTDEIVDNPIAFCSSLNLPLPKSLVNSKYSPGNSIKKFEEIINKYYPDNFPPNYLDATSALICATSLSSQLQLCALVQKSSVNNLAIQSSSEYMFPQNWDTVGVMMNDLTSFITTTQQLSALFHGRSGDVWQMAKMICGFGCKFLVVDDGRNGYYLYDSIKDRKIQLPAYPGMEVDPTGSMEAFCGGFLAGLKIHQNPVMALLSGSISASITAEGSGPFYAQDSTPGLLEARFSRIKNWYKIL
jgi:hypothetical protein